MDEPLRRTSDSISTPKFKVNCGVTHKNPTTQGWLTNLTYLKTIDKIKSKMTNKSILEGIFLKDRPVVVKISNERENLEHEYAMYEELVKHNVAGIVHYYCYFECNDSIHRALSETTAAQGLCNGPGKSMRILVMDYIKNKSFGLHNWKDSLQIKSCIKQVICTTLDAYLKCGFIHGDLNCNNILIKNTSRKNATYTFPNSQGNENTDITIPLYGYKILLIDFECSKINASVNEFYKGFRREFTSSLINYITRFDYINYNSITDIGNKFNEYYTKANYKEDALWILDIFQLIDKL